ncbi:MAG: 3-oxoacyl-[acyl-carrier-protein] reductase [bacterium]
MTGRIAVVTGASRNIGRAIALHLAEAGAELALVGRDEAALEEVALAVRALGRGALPFRCAVEDAAESAKTVEKIIERFGALDILVNNAGVTRDKLLIRMDEADWNEVLAVNLTGAFHFAKGAARQMIRQKRGRIVNITSVIGQIGNAGQANYAASKGGLIAFTKSLAKELAPRGITVNAIAPGFIETAMTQGLSAEVRDKLLHDIPLGRFGTPDDVADVALFLASDPAAYITGQVLNVDGGMVMI